MSHPTLDPDIDRLAREVLALCRAQGLTVATAESCTGGLVAAALTDIAGSSDVVDRGFVTYSNAAKQKMLGVSDATLQTFGAVSLETAAAMVEGVLMSSSAHLAVAITGIAGPGGATATKPVGLVCFGVMRRGGNATTQEVSFGDQGRAEVRRRSVIHALQMLCHAAGRVDA
jgi:nicotinamide-nucleotide amidase